MRKTGIFVILISIFLLTACTSSGGNPLDTSLPEENSLQSNTSTAESNKPEKIELPTLTSFLNFDELEQYRMMTGTGKELSEEDLKTLSIDKKQKDYVEVVKAYIKQEMKQEPIFLDSVDGTYNPKKVIVGSKEGNIYLLQLQKWYNYNEIWTVKNHALLDDKENAVSPRKSVEYQIVDEKDLSTSLQKQLNQKIASGEKHSYIHEEGITYILLKAPEGQSVEVKNIFGDEFSIEIDYSVIGNTYPEYGENPQLLIKVDSPISDIIFREYSSIKTDLERLNMP